MSSDTVIRVEDLGKKYRLGVLRHDTLRDRLAHALAAPWRRGRQRAADPTEFWALRDVSFAVNRGEVIGIIGRNGAGKSTLLKILSRITEPTIGRVTLAGRVASLLEVGTGFHPELSGRENVFLNGAILGMSRAEIRRKFDEIVAFAEVEKFLDTPVKHYSSGMYVRLAFAVAAHLEPDILIIDEVLAVGDASFQKKCLGKMQDVASRQGRTVLFVSHNLVAMQAICSRAMLLVSGRRMFDGTPVETVDRYLHEDLGAPAAAHQFQGRDPAVRIERAAFVRDASPPAIEIDLTVRTAERRHLALEFILQTTAGAPVAFADCGTLDFTRCIDFPPGDSRLAWRIAAGSLANGSYVLRTQLVDAFAHVVLRHEHGEIIEVTRVPTGAHQRILELNWQSGAVELPLQRLPDPPTR